MSEYDVVVLGASGYTGRLAARHLLAVYGRGSDYGGGRKGLRIAFGGRSMAKLTRVKAELCQMESAAEGVALVEVDVGAGGEALKALVLRTKVVLNMAGPYPTCAEAVVKACAENGTDYCDLSGEVVWHAEMIGKYHDVALRSGARIVFSLGMSSAPSDFAVFLVAEEMMKKFNSRLGLVRLVWTELSSGLSGGTAASWLAEGGMPTEVRSLMSDPYLLNPAGMSSHLPRIEDQKHVLFDVDAQRYTIPFVNMVPNSRVVRRSNALLGFRYGESAFVYSEAFGAGFQGDLWGLISAQIFLLMLRIIFFLARFSEMTRSLLRLFLPRPGTGPSDKQLAAGRGFAEITARDENGLGIIRARIGAPYEPGYKLSSIIIVEAAVHLAVHGDSSPELMSKKGCLTPAACFEGNLMPALQREGMVWEILL